MEWAATSLATAGLAALRGGHVRQQPRATQARNELAAAGAQTRSQARAESRAAQARVAVAGAGAIAGSSGAGAGSGGVAGSAGSDAVAGAGAIAGNAGSDAVAGAGGVGPTSTCAVGGALFVVGNYADTAGNQFILRAAPKAATFALIPTGAAHPTRPPQLFLVKRVCAPGGALIASDGSSNYRVDFMQTGSQLAICWSGSVATLEAALVLPPADGSHAASTGCAGHAFTVYSAGTL
ncbi:MAG: hypothetical protein WDO74_07445 [Pseudomonadota bacterium]